jgi:hypothetical protein
MLPGPLANSRFGLRHSVEKGIAVQRHALTHMLESAAQRNALAF